MGDSQRLIPQTVTVAEAAGLLNISPQKTYRLFHRGELLGYRADDKILIFKDSLVGFVDRNRNKPPPEPPKHVPQPRQRRARWGNADLKVFQHLPSF